MREAARPLTGADDDDDALLDLIGDARGVLLGEATHGTHEFYSARARITSSGGAGPVAGAIHALLDGKIQNLWCMGSRRRGALARPS